MPKKQDSKIKLSIAGFFFFCPQLDFSGTGILLHINGLVATLAASVTRPGETPHPPLTAAYWETKHFHSCYPQQTVKKRMPLPHLGTGRDPIVDDRLSQP